jgi:hypothetical protein
MSEPKILVVPCTWLGECGAMAIRRRLDPFVGKYKPVCAKHAANATPFELLPLEPTEKAS